MACLSWLSLFTAYLIHTNTRASDACQARPTMYLIVMAMIDKIVYAVSLDILYKEEISFCIMSAGYPLVHASLMKYRIVHSKLWYKDVYLCTGLVIIIKLN